MPRAYIVYSPIAIVVAFVMVATLVFVICYSLFWVSPPTVIVQNQNPSASTSRILLARDSVVTGNEETIYGSGLHPPNCGENATEVTILGSRQCMCNSPYYGYKCERENVSSGYFDVGAPASGTVEYSGDIIGPTYDTNLSFDGTQNCTEMCDSLESCAGVWYSGHKCYLLSNSPTLSAPATLSLPSTIYLKNGLNPVVSDRVFLNANTGTFPTKWWNLQQDTGDVRVVKKSYQQAEGRSVYYTGTGGFNVVNGTGLTGVWSSSPLSSSQTTSVLNGSQIDGVKTFVDRSSRPEFYFVNLAGLGFTGGSVYVKYF